jgi:hypothetical protein
MPSLDTFVIKFIIIFCMFASYLVSVYFETINCTVQHD